MWFVSFALGVGYFSKDKVKIISTIWRFYFAEEWITVVRSEVATGGVLWKKVSLIFFKTTGKHLCRSLIFEKVVGLRPETLLKERSR